MLVQKKKQKNNLKKERRLNTLARWIFEMYLVKLQILSGKLYASVPVLKMS